MTERGAAGGDRRAMTITIWDSSPRRIAAIERNLLSAAAREGLELRLGVMSEIPLLARHGLEGGVPALEIAGNFWRLRPFDIFTEAECRTLLRALSKDRPDGGAGISPGGAAEAAVCRRDR